MEIEIQSPFGERLASISLKIEDNQIVASSSAVGPLVRLVCDGVDVHSNEEPHGLGRMKEWIVRKDGDVFTIDQLIIALMEMRKKKAGDEGVYVETYENTRGTCALIGVFENERGSVCLNHA